VDQVEEREKRQQRAENQQRREQHVAPDVALQRLHRSSAPMCFAAGHASDRSVAARPMRAKARTDALWWNSSTTTSSAIAWQQQARPQLEFCAIRLARC
jgi:hypothetical protein